MARRLALGLVLLLLVAAPAGADNSARRRAVEQRIARLNAQVANATAKTKVLQSQIDGVSSQIRTVERQVDVADLRLAPIEKELVLREIKLNRLNALLQLQSDRLRFLRRQYRIALSRLNHQLVAIYESEPADTLAVVFSASSFSDFLDAFDYAKQIGQEDHSIADAVERAKESIQAQRTRTAAVRGRVLGETRAIAYRVHEARELRDQLVSGRDRLTRLRSRRQISLDSLSASERREEVEIGVLRQRDLALAGIIQKAQSAGPVDVTPSSAGLIWPVNGPITSGFGPRWGSFHYGLDIAAGLGTPIRAAAAGRVIYAGWYGGFGNFVVIDHGGGLATTYGHQTQIVVALGDQVAQGQLIGYVGSTGFSTGPHLDFEVRVNGQPVDPLGYL